MGSACSPAAAPSVEVHDDSEATISDLKRRLDKKMYWSGGLSFEKGSAALKPESVQAAAGLAAILKMYPKLGVTVESYTGNQGDAKKALLLSIERAKAVKAALAQNCDNVIVAKGVGYTEGEGPRTQLVPSKSEELAGKDDDASAVGGKSERQCTNGCSIQ
mmetsp:Transcript_16452/g.33332  ORF Transcript_16452/g.33332 Transcript_16452/m.33332 type:complete len:161 (-) Transcript_16452:87-569(-)